MSYRNVSKDVSLVLEYLCIAPCVFRSDDMMFKSIVW